MKFGETLHQRSVPQWSTYNFKYNEIKRLVKERTSTQSAGAVAIPNGPVSNRWIGLEDELISILQDEYDNITLFLNSKRGEIERRLAFLEKQVRSARKAAEQLHANVPLQSRRFHKLLADAESIGQDIQNLTRFASVQKTAFRKLLKKYRKWTGSGGMQVRVENEILTTRKLNLDYAHQLDRLAVQITIINNQLLPVPLRTQTTDQSNASSSSVALTATSIVADIQEAEVQSPIALDVALSTLPFGSSSGFAAYWIHPDNLDEARALLLHHVREVPNPASRISRESSNVSIASTRSSNRSAAAKPDNTYVAYFDNEKRLMQDTSTNKPSKAALSARYGEDTQAIVTLSNLSTQAPLVTRVNLRRKELSKALDGDVSNQIRDPKQSETSKGVQEVRKFLVEHEDIKPLAQMRSTRSRYAGTSNSPQAGLWASFDVDIVFSPFRCDASNESVTDSASGESFPHAVLEIRWENCAKPQVVRIFDTTHLAEKVKDFTLESAAIAMVNDHLESPQWQALLEKDIRKVPATTRTSSTMRGHGARTRAVVIGTSSGPSSDGPADSVFSGRKTVSSTTSGPSPSTSTRDLSLLGNANQPITDSKGKKKVARIDAQPPQPQTRQNRYWNEFDDGDEDVNPHESYVIYINPDDSLPGAKTISKAFGAIYKSVVGTTSRVSSLLSLKSHQPAQQQKLSERSRLLRGMSNTNSEADSSDSDSTPTQEFAPKFGTFPKSQPRDRAGSVASLYRTRRVLTPRQVALERTYFMFYIGLIVLSFVLLFVCGVLLTTGRKKAYIEVDVATIAGVVAAEVCAVVSMILLWMRRTPLSILHRGLVQSAIIILFVMGIGEAVALVIRSK